MNIRISLCLLLSLIAVSAQEESFAIADSLYAIGNYKAAINVYATITSPNSSVQIARAYNAIGNYDKAIIQYEYCIESDDTLQIPKIELGRIYLKMNQPDKAASLFYDLISEGTVNPEYYYYMGRALIDLQDDRQSIQFFKTAIALDSTHLRSIYQLGKYYLQQQGRDSVLKYVNKGLRFYSSDGSLINLKALVYFNNHEYENSKPLFQQLIHSGEHKAYLYSKLAFCYLNNMEFKKADVQYRKLLEFDGSKAEAYSGLGHIHWEAKQLDSAAFFLKKAISEKKPNLAIEYEELARLAREQNDKKAALEYYTKAFQEDPSNYFIYYQICTLSDQFFKDPQIRLKYYQQFMEWFGDKDPYMSDIARKRIRKLKEEIPSGQNGMPKKS